MFRVQYQSSITHRMSRIIRVAISLLGDDSSSELPWTKSNEKKTASLAVQLIPTIGDFRFTLKAN